MGIKKELIIGIVGSIFVIFLTFFYFSRYQKQKEQLKISSAIGNVSQSNTNSNDTVSNISLTSSEIAKHSSASDCWIIIQNSVYNVTQYLNLHPGGSSQIVPFCGQDATNAFASQGGKGSHSSQANQDLSLLKLGQLNETVNVINKDSQIQNNISTQPLKKGNKEFEDD